MAANKAILILSWLLAVTLPAAKAPRVCPGLLGRIGISLGVTKDPRQRRLVEPANLLARAVLGELVPAEPAVEVRYVSCNPASGCHFSPLWNVIQMDHEPLLQNPDAFGAVYIHELAHSIQANANPEIQKLRVELAGLKQSQLKGWAQFHRKRKQIMDTYASDGLWGLWYFFSNAEAKLSDLQTGLHEELVSALASQGHIRDEFSSEKPRPEDFLRVSAGEVFGDLVSCAAYGDGDAIAKSLKVLDGQEHPDRKNSDVSNIPTAPEWVTIEQQDVHHFFIPARRAIWARHLNGKSKSEIQKILRMLDTHTREWPITVAALAEPADKRGGYRVDKNLLNRQFLQAWEARLNPISH